MNTEYQYWVVGANWDGDDKADAFFRRGYWELGWSDQDQPKMAQQRDAMQPGDRIAVKSMRGRGADSITIKGIGRIKEIDSDKRVYVDWILIELDREVPAHGCLKSIHGPYSIANDSEWLAKVFIL